VLCEPPLRPYTKTRSATALSSGSHKVLRPITPLGYLPGSLVRSVYFRLMELQDINRSYGCRRGNRSMLFQRRLHNDKIQQPRFRWHNVCDDRVWPSRWLQSTFATKLGITECLSSTSKAHLRSREEGWLFVTLDVDRIAQGCDALMPVHAARRRKPG
jgi:hypothetical protein